ncbi:MAG TPA: serine/threonine-protein kinase [Ktedonobacteraceae bacterium]
MPSALPPGTTVGGHYTIGNLMNNGGFGAVYRGIDLSEGQRPCAIKETYDVTPAARRRALLEASVLFTVRSKQLPEVYDAFESNGRFYLVMQLIEGQDLLQVLRARVGNVPLGEQAPFQLSQGPCSEQEILTWLLPIMEVLQELHSRNPPIMHRDIKPANIILTPDQRTVLVDFGLTRLYDPNVSTQTLGRAITPGFSPLEQYVGGTNPQSDLYSLAATMYLLLTNRLPPAATSRTPHDGLLPPRQLNPALSSRMEQALLKALSLHADQRFQSMREFAQAVREPTFTAFADRTVPLVLPGVPDMPSPSPLPPTPPVPVQKPSLAATQAVSPDSRTYQAVQPPVATTRPGQKNPAPDSRTYQAVQPPVATTRPGQTNTAQMSVPYAVSARPLPGSFGQGCLWGLMQGVLGAVLVLTMRQEGAFYLATLIGYGFYVLAGFLTTRRGGSPWRGIWAGYWSGISSTVMFWIVLWIGLLFRAAQYLQEMHTGNRNPLASGDFRRALDAVSPQYPPVYKFLPHQPDWVNFLVLLGGGLLIAMILGGYGGSLGRRRFKARLERRQTVKA